MKKDKITLNEEISRMRFLFKAQSGKKMTISEINKTYLIEQATPQQTTTTTINLANRRPLPTGGDIVVMKGNSSTSGGTIVQRAGNDQETCVFMGVPATINFSDPNMAPLTNVRIIQNNITNRGNPLNEFYSSIRILITSRPFQNANNLTQDNNRLNGTGSQAVLQRYLNLVVNPLVNLMTNAPYNLPSPMPPNFTWGTYFTNLDTRINSNPNAINQLRTAVNNAYTGIQRFISFLSNPRTSYNDSGSTGPIVGYTAPQMAVGGVQMDIQGALQQNGNNDVIIMTIFLRSPEFGNSNSTTIATNATIQLANAFYDSIIQGRAGRISTQAINIPSIANLLLDNRVTTEIAGWQDANVWQQNVSILAINITVKSAFPNLITFNPNTVNVGGALFSFGS